MFQNGKQANSAAIIAVWLIGVFAGVCAIDAYVNGAGESGKPASDWPADCGLRLDAQRETLLMFVHPRCPCTRASMRELERIVSAAGDRIATRVIVFQPHDKPEDWSHTDLWNSATEIPGAEVIADVDAKLTKKFGVATSGHVLLYTPQGRLVFSGGITAGRGHEGDNVGESSIGSFVSGSDDSTSSCPVFGCPIIQSN